MKWLENYATANPVAYSILLVSLVAVVGLGFASIKIRGIGLGVTGVLFAGLIFGHFGFHLEHHTMEFLWEFGLILFVFTIGLQIGPGFFASLRDQGLVLNSLAAAIVIGGGVLTVILAKIFGIAFGAAAGLFSGATTNTPSLGAGQQTLIGMNVDEAFSGDPALSYAVAYPLGIVGIIVSMIIVRVLFRVDVKEEVAQFEKSQRSGGQPIERLNLRVDNANLDWQVARTPGIPLYNYLLDQHVNLECYIWKAWTDPLAMRSSDLQAGSIRPVVVQVGVEEADRESPANVNLPRSVLRRV